MIINHYLHNSLQLGWGFCMSLVNKGHTTQFRINPFMLIWQKNRCGFLVNADVSSLHYIYFCVEIEMFLHLLYTSQFPYAILVALQVLYEGGSWGLAHEVYYL
jgi:hypothetical protein